MKHQLENTEVRVEVVVKASIEKTFATFTDRCHDWWPKEYKLGKADRMNVVIEPQVGGRWYEVGADGSECIWGKVLEWNPPHSVAFSWQIKPDFTPEPNPEKSSRVHIRFTEKGSRSTTITLVHSEFERHGEGWEAMRDGVNAEGGWPGILDRLASLTEHNSSHKDKS